MARKKRILIFYIQKMSGHYSAAAAIEKAFMQKYPDVEVKILDFMQYINPVIAKLILNTYSNVIRRSPDAWNYLYDNPKILEKSIKLRDLLVKMNLTRIRKLIASFKPSLIICTQAVPCGALAFYKRKIKSQIPMIGVLTDYTAHSYWFYDEVNYYIVPSEREKWRIMSKGIEEEKIRVFGIPIDDKFKLKHSKNSLIKKFGLNKEELTLLIMGGNQGLGHIKQIVNRLSRLHCNLQMLIVTGNNKNLLKKITNKKSKGKYIKNIKIFSHVDYIDELMEVSDFIITKPGGMTVTEALAKNCPMILINPIPGQEMHNCEYLVSEQAAVKAKDEDELITIVSELAENPEQLKEINFQIERIKKVNAASDIADLGMEIHEEK